MKIKEIIKAIENKQMPEKYDEWLHHDHIDIRCALANIDYKPEILIYIELTMSPQQLYEIGSPLWARGLPLRKVFDILTDDYYEWSYDSITDADNDE